MEKRAQGFCKTLHPFFQAILGRPSAQNELQDKQNKALESPDEPPENQFGVRNNSSISYQDFHIDGGSEMKPRNFSLCSPRPFSGLRKSHFGPFVFSRGKKGAGFL